MYYVQVKIAYVYSQSERNVCTDVLKFVKAYRITLGTEVVLQFTRMLYQHLQGSVSDCDNLTSVSVSVKYTSGPILVLTQRVRQSARALQYEQD